MRPAVRAQRARRGHAPRSATCRPGQARSSRSSSSWRRPRTSPASPAWPTAPRELFGEVFGDAGSHARSAVGVPVLPLDAPVEVELDRRGLADVDPTRRLPRDLVEHARAFADGGRDAGRAQARLDRRAAARRRRRAGRARGLPAAPARRHGVRRRACACSPAAGSTRATSTPTIGWVGPTPARVGRRCSAPTRRSRGRWCAPRSARRSRSPACCSPGPTEDSVVGDTTGDDWEADRRRARGPRAVVHRLPRPARACGCAPTCCGCGARWVTPVFEPRRLRHPVLRGRAARGPGHPRRVAPSPTRWSGCRCARRSAPSTPARHADAAADVLHAAWRCTTSRTPADVLAAADGPRPDLGRAAGRGRRRGRLPVDPRPAGPARRGRRGADAPVSRAPGPAGRSASGRAACSRRTPDMMTLDGTNTWVLREPGAARSVVVDPGPQIDEHLDAVAAHAGDVARRAAHPRPPRPHRGARGRSRSGSAAACARSTRRTGSATRASATATWSRSTGSRCTSSAPPGTPPTRCRSCCRPERAVLTGDTVLGRGTTVVAHPDGAARRLPRLAAPAARARRGAGRDRACGRATVR